MAYLLLFSLTVFPQVFFLKFDVCDSTLATEQYQLVLLGIKFAAAANSALTVKSVNCYEFSCLLKLSYFSQTMLSMPGPNSKAA